MRGASAGARCRATPAGPGSSLRSALRAMAEELDPVMLDRETGAGGHPPGQSLRVRLGDGRLDVHDASAAEARKVMMGSNVGVVASRRSGEFTDQSRVDELPEVAVDGA